MACTEHGSNPVVKNKKMMLSRVTGVFVRKEGRDRQGSPWNRRPAQGLLLLLFPDGSCLCVLFHVGWLIQKVEVKSIKLINIMEEDLKGTQEGQEEMVASALDSSWTCLDFEISGPWVHYNQKNITVVCKAAPMCLEMEADGKRANKEQPVKETAEYPGTVTTFPRYPMAPVRP